MVQLCIVQKYGIGAYPKSHDEYFMFYDTISDMPLFFCDEFLFQSKEDFLFYAKDDKATMKELERFTGKIPPKFGGDE